MRPEEVEMTKGGMTEEGNGPRKWNLEAISPYRNSLGFRYTGSYSDRKSVV